MDNCYLDALAVITFFKMSHKKHLFITGERGSGKSYLLKRGVEMEMPRSVLEVLMNAENQNDFAFDYMEKVKFQEIK